MNPISSTIRQSAAAATLAAMITMGLLGSLGLLATSYHDEAAMAQGTMAQAASAAVTTHRVVVTVSRNRQS